MFPETKGEAFLINTAFKDVRLSTLFSMKRAGITVTHCHIYSLFYLLPSTYFYPLVSVKFQKRCKCQLADNKGEG